MAQNWTPEQLEAITRRDCNLLVAAGAGAGKTAVLVERIIRKITDSERPVDIDRLLVVTFTNAAATEMRERIGDALAAALEADPSSQNLHRQMALLDRASIMTLHSFCLEVVRSHFHSLDLDPLFRIADETEGALMKLDVLDELFEEKYEIEEKESIFFKLVESYGGGRDDSALREMILTLHRFTRSHPWPEHWLAAQAEAPMLQASACLSSTPWAQVLLKGAAAELQGLSALLEKAAARASRRQGLEPYCGVLEADREQLRKLLSLCEAAIAADATTVPDTHPAADSTASAPTGAAASGDEAWDKLHHALSSMEFARLPRCGKDANTAAQEEVKSVRSQMKERLKKLFESGFDATAEQCRADFEKLYPHLQYLSDMVCRFEEMFMQKKKSKSLLDFNDLEHYCLKVLIEDGIATPAADELSEKYEEILVDEYQDSNLIQELILETVSGMRSGRNNIFMVGDVKQSIYRFRQAKPELFMSKYLSYPSESGYDRQMIQLYKNFRSRDEVISGVNFIFRQIMSVQVGELDYTQKEYLNPGAHYEDVSDDCTAGGAIEVHILDVTSDLDEITPGELQDTDQTGDVTAKSSTDAEIPVGPESFAPARISVAAGVGRVAVNEVLPSPVTERTSTAAGSYAVDVSASANGSSVPGISKEQAEGSGDGTIDEEESLDNIQSEARIVGKRIRSLVSQEQGGFVIYDKKLKDYRTAQYKDIVILMRATKNWADIFTDELAVMGIPAYADTGLGYFRTVEVETMLSLLQIIDNPLQDIPMLAVLRSPMFAFSTDELADIRLADRSVTIYEAMKSGSQAEGSLAGDIHAKTVKFLEQLQNWRNAAQFTSTDELVWQLLTETGYYSYVGILPGGPERQANLRVLFERARQYEETSYKGLFNFINFINRLRSGGGDMGSAKILGENDNVVRIMSIHKSKGLEFPVVILAGCGKKFNMLDLNAGILLHQELGFGPDLVDLDKRTITPAMSKFAIRQKLRLETLSEEMRIMYVAFTRAREKLIITGSVRNLPGVCARWCANANTENDKLPPYSAMQATNYLDWIGSSIIRHESGKSLRLAAEVQEEDCLILEEPSCWDVKLWGAGAAKVKKETAKAEENIRNWLKDEDRNLEFSGQLIEKLEWQYQYKKLSAIPAKISVTELKRRFLQEEQQDSAEPYIPPMVERPLFMEQENALSAAAKGTIMHFVMQNIDIERLAKVQKQNADRTDESAEVFAEEIRAQIASMTANEKLTTAEAQTVRPEAIAAFFATIVGKRILSNEAVHREMTFNIQIKCSEIYSELAGELYGDETMLLQGVIDCWFETDDGIVLLDYKTDYVPEGGEEVIRKRYGVQIEYYTRALEKITGKKVSEKYLYLFHTGQLLPMP